MAEQSRGDVRDRSRCVAVQGQDPSAVMALEVMHVRDRGGESEPRAVADDAGVRFADEDLLGSCSIPQVSPGEVDDACVQDEVLAVEAAVRVGHDMRMLAGFGTQSAGRLGAPWYRPDDSVGGAVTGAFQKDVPLVWAAVGQGLPAMLEDVGIWGDYPCPVRFHPGGLPWKNVTKQRVAGPLCIPGWHEGVYVHAWAILPAGIVQVKVIERPELFFASAQIGRASCRGSVSISGVA